MKRDFLRCAMGVFAAVALTACPGGDNNNGDGGTDGGNGFPQPANTVAINFSIDASGRPDFYEDGDLEWKGSFTYDEETRILTYDQGWAGGAGPYAPLYDDGPWSEGGHEPAGATAGDDIFGVTVFLEKPTEELTIAYGAQTCCGSTGGWIWPGPGDGSLVVPANAAGPLTAEGFEMTPSGKNDARLSLDVSQLGSGFTVTENSTIEVKGNFYLPNPWSLKTPQHVDGTVHTYVLSEDTSDPRGALLLASGAAYEFVWVIDGTEYKNASEEAETAGVSVEVKPEGGAFADVDVTVNEKANTEFTVP